MYVVAVSSLLFSGRKRYIRYKNDIHFCRYGLFQVFVLSEAGKPIFASCGSEEQLCSLAALIQTFVMVVGSWADSLIRFRSLKTHICFSYRSPLILAIVSRTPFNLESQLDILYKQVFADLVKITFQKSHVTLLKISNFYRFSFSWDSNSWQI